MPEKNSWPTKHSSNSLKNKLLKKLVIIGKYKFPLKTKGKDYNSDPEPVFTKNNNNNSIFDMNSKNSQQKKNISDSPKLKIFSSPNSSSNTPNSSPLRLKNNNALIINKVETSSQISSKPDLKNTISKKSEIKPIIQKSNISSFPQKNNDNKKETENFKTTLNDFRIIKLIRKSAFGEVNLI